MGRVEFAKALAAIGMDFPKELFPSAPEWRAAAEAYRAEVARLHPPMPTTPAEFAAPLVDALRRLGGDPSDVDALKEFHKAVEGVLTQKDHRVDASFAEVSRFAAAEPSLFCSAVGNTTVVAALAVAMAGRDLGAARDRLLADVEGAIVAKHYQFSREQRPPTPKEAAEMVHAARQSMLLAAGPAARQAADCLYAVTYWPEDVPLDRQAAVSERMVRSITDVVASADEEYASRSGERPIYDSFVAAGHNFESAVVGRAIGELRGRRMDLASMPEVEAATSLRPTGNSPVVSALREMDGEPVVQSLRRNGGGMVEMFRDVGGKLLAMRELAKDTLELLKEKVFDVAGNPFTSRKDADDIGMKR